jgi:hypothetical protein
MLKTKKKWTPLNSSNLAACRYFRQTGLLLIEFRSGSIYGYAGVGWPTYMRFRYAESHGSYFARNIRESFQYKEFSPTELSEAGIPVPPPESR